VEDDNLVLSKKEIQGGIKATSDVHIPSLNGEVRIRPISSREWQQVQEIESKAFGKIQTGGMNVNPRAKKEAMGQEVMKNLNMNMDLAKLSKSEYDAKVKCLTYGLSILDGEKWTEQDVHELAMITVDEIYSEILAISGIPETSQAAKQLKGELESFPEDG
jgi:hypothetical protein